jgi:hypothetical protein
VRLCQCAAVPCNHALMARRGVTRGMDFGRNAVKGQHPSSSSLDDTPMPCFRACQHSLDLGR